MNKEKMLMLKPFDLLSTLMTLGSLCSQLNVHPFGFTAAQRDCYNDHKPVLYIVGRVNICIKVQVLETFFFYCQQTETASGLHCVSAAVKFLFYLTNVLKALAEMLRTRRASHWWPLKLFVNRTKKKMYLSEFDTRREEI